MSPIIAGLLAGLLQQGCAETVVPAPYGRLTGKIVCDNSLPANIPAALIDQGTCWPGNAPTDDRRPVVICDEPQTPDGLDPPGSDVPAPTQLLADPEQRA